MKTFNIKSSILSLIALFFVAAVAQAQYDDIYYSATDEAHFTEIQEEYVPEARNDYGYSSFAEDDGYYYTSRIRRFSRPSNSISYFSPVYTNAFNYGGYTPFGFTTGSAFNRSSVFSNNAFAFSSFSNPYLTPVNSFGRVNTFNRFNTFGGGGFSNAYYCPPVGGFTANRIPTTNNFSNTANTRNVSNVSSARRSGSVTNSTQRRTTTSTTRKAISRTGTQNSVRRSTPSSRSTRSIGTSRSTSTRSSSSFRSSPSRSSSSTRSSSSSSRRSRS